MQEPGRSWLLGTVLRPRWDLEVPIRSSPVLCKEGTAWGCCPSPHAEGCVLAALCARSEGQAALCVRQSVQGSRQVCAGTEGRSCSCCRGDQETARLRPAHRLPLLRGLPAQRHRSAGLTEEEPHPERHRSSAYRAILEDAALVEMLCPYEKELQQPVAELPM